LAFFIGTVALVAAGSVDSRQVLLRTIVPFGSLYYAYVYMQRRTSQVRGSGQPTYQHEGHEEAPRAPDERTSSAA
jgi:hypothetical protein